MRLRHWGAAVAAAGALVGCSGSGALAPVSGDLTISLATSDTSVGGILLRVTGQVQGVKAAGTYQATTATQDSTTRVIITGPITAGALLTIHIPDVSKTSQYSASVEQVASRTDYSLLATAGYALVVSPK